MLQVHPFIHTCWLVCLIVWISDTRWLVCSFLRPFIHSSRSFTRPYLCLYNFCGVLFVHSFVRFFVCPCVRLFVCSILSAFLPCLSMCACGLPDVLTIPRSMLNQHLLAGKPYM